MTKKVQKSFTMFKDMCPDAVEAIEQVQYAAEMGGYLPQKSQSVGDTILELWKGFNKINENTELDHRAILICKLEKMNAICNYYQEFFIYANDKIGEGTLQELFFEKGLVDADTIH